MECGEARPGPRVRARCRREAAIAIYVTSLGCRLNQAEAAALRRALARLGHEMVSEARLADVVVLNTCAVTAEAERKSRQLLRRLHRESPGARILVTGCYPQLDRDLGGAAGLADAVVDNVAKRRLLEAPEHFIPPASAANGRAAPALRARALVRVQEGCDNRCSYCVVWRLRGEQVSRPAGDVLAEVRQLVAEGRQEVVLTGVHIGAYGRDRLRPEVPDLSGLLRLILDQTTVRRLRLSSIEPWDLRHLDLSLWSDPRLCPHLHVPLQSGSDTVLGRMARRYSAAEYERAIARAREAIPDLAVTTDVIAGFPGESELDLEATVALSRRCGFARMHVFRFSPRPGTAAAHMPDQVPPEVIRDRAARLREVAAELAAGYEAGYVGRTMSVLWERKREGWWSGLTPNYLRVRTRHAEDLSGRATSTRLCRRDRYGLVGEVVREPHAPGDLALQLQ
ncbi:MAG: tRNA (N(6)-L-threonylcarbamoyladenosine(37)-C(2))-methylthiotransferase MtaB [Anaerolineae bacterium]|nr:tRNA (N(6)-L-threonylcarbamoyladenosine(37)-C(2))-methylthiotransferase MtaB [Anaerolineae bacterium]